MRIELVVVSGCPHADVAGSLLRRALDDIGLGSQSFQVVTVESAAEAAERQFPGSPTFMVDGHDVLAEPGRPAALACRIYPGGENVPGLRELRRALKEAAAARVPR